MLAKALDALCLMFAAIWLAGGIPWPFPSGDRWVLAHGADPRRAALLIAAVIWLVPSLRASSLVMRIAYRAWDWLLFPANRWRVLSGLALLSIVLGILQTYAVRYTLYDVGIYHQVIWGLARGDWSTSTISNTGNYLLYDHLSLSYLLLVPFFWLTGSHPATLPVLHALLAWGGVAAWIWMVEGFDRVASERRQRIAAGTLVFFAAFESLWANFRWGFHDTAISFCALSWAFAIAFRKGKEPRARLAVCALLLVAAFSKEIILLDVGILAAIWGVGFALSGRRPPAIGAGLATIACFAAFFAFQAADSPTRKNYFERYYAYAGDSMGDLIVTALTRPWVVGQNVGWGELMGYFVTLLGPFLAMPLLARWSYPSSSGAPEIQKIPPRLWLLATVPSLASAVLSTWPYHRRADFHHVFDIWPFLLLLTILYLSKTRSKRWILAWAFLALLTMKQDPWGQLREYGRGAIEAAPLREAFAKIPAEGWVMAEDNTGPWLARRRETTRYPERVLFGDRCPDWLVLQREPELVRTYLERDLPDCVDLYLDSAPVEVNGWRVYQR